MLLRRLLLPSAVALLLLPLAVSPASAQFQSLGVLVIAHGSGPTWNAPVESAVDVVGRTMPAAVGFLMGKGATPQQAYDALVRQGVAQIVVVPLLISSHSAHAEQIRFLAGARPDYPHAEHMQLVPLKGPVPIATVTPAMDDDPLIAAILADRARALSRDPKAETLVLVAHGPNDDDEAAEWTMVMKQLAAYIRTVSPFRAVDTRLLRDDAPKPVKDRALAELHEAVAASAASGRVVVVPLLLSPGAVADEIPATLKGLDFGWDGRTLLPDDRIAQWILARARGVPSQVGHASGTGRATDTRSAISGTVTDVTGVPAVGAVVVLRQTAMGLERVTRTDGRGAFAFRDLTSATYEIVASLSGFAPVRQTLRAPTDSSVSLVLSPAPYEEAVTVVSDARGDRLREMATLPVTVVGGEAMRDASYATVGDALREVAGVVTRRGSEGTDVGGEQIQGIDSRQVLVLMDGQPIVGARGIKSGAINLDRQPTVGLDRIEIVKGAASALYGSDAMGGVINLIPRDPRRPVEAAGHVGAGNYGAVDTAADIGGLARWGTFFLSGGHHQRDAFDLTPSTPDTTGAAIRRRDVAGRLVLAPSASWLVTGHATSYWNTLTGRSVGELGTEDARTPSHAQTYAARAEWRVNSRTTAEFRAYRGRYQETSTAVLLNAARTPLDPGNLAEDLVKIDGSLFRSIGERHQLRGGVEWVRDEYRGRNRIRDAEGNAVTTGVAWGQYDLNPFRALTITTGVRYDDHALFGAAVSLKVAVVERLTDWLTARASYGRGFRAPDVGQLYYRFLNPTNLYQVIGNPHLEPERSNSWQVGVESRPGSRAGAGLNLFHNDVTNLIQAVNLGMITSTAQVAAVAAANDITPDFDVQLNRLLFLYRNVARARTRGVELSGNYRMGQVARVSGTYAYVDAIDAKTGAALSNRNAHQGTVRVDWTPMRYGIRANLRGAFYSSWIAGSTRSVAGTSNIYAPAFALWDLTVSKTVIRTMEVFGAVNNLTNSQDPNAGVVSPTGAALPIYRPEIGRTFRVGVRWNWMK